MKQKINLHLALVAFLAVAAAALAVTLVFYGLFRQQVRNDLRMSAELLRDTGLFDAQTADSDALDALKTAEVRITWVASDGTVLYDNGADSDSLGNHADRPEIAAALSAGTGESVRRSDTMNLDTYYYALLLTNGTVLRCAAQARTITGVFLTALPAVLGILVLVLAACILLGHLLTKQLLRPINRMAEHLDDSPETPAYRELEPFAAKIRAQHDKILSAAKSRQDFTANVSHELKTPLTAITGYAELIETGLAEAEQTPHLAAQIRRSAERLLALINDIIRLSELDRADSLPSMTHFDLLALARECCESLTVHAGQRDVYLSCAGTSAEVSGDRELLRELIENLTENGIRYNKSGGYVRITVHPEDGHAVLSVRDNGIGIAPEDQERVFERFYRVDRSRSRETGGTGLGLSIVRHIAELHGAQIFLTSEPGRGTSITVRF